MKVSLVVSSDKFTGAAAVAENWWQSLKQIGIEARFSYVRGANLQRRLEGVFSASASLVKERRFSDLRSNVRELRSLARSSDVVMTFLPHDHLLAVMAGVQRHTCLVRAFRNPRHLYRDPFHVALARRADGALAPFHSLVPQVRKLMRGRPVGVIPAPVEDRFSTYLPAIPAGELPDLDSTMPILGMVGKLAAGRGFELLLDAAALTRYRCRPMIVGHGELQPDLEARAATLGIDERIIWTGKRESDLPALFHAMNAVLFAAPGSDWGHRMITEAQATGRPIIAVDYPGVDDLVRNEHTGIVVRDDASEVASAMDRLISDPTLAAALADSAHAEVAQRRFGPIGTRLANFLEACLEGRRALNQRRLSGVVKALFR